MVLVGRVVWEDVDVVIREEGMYLVLVVLLIYNDYGFALIGLCDYGVVFTEFVVDVPSDVSLSLVYVVSVRAGVLYLFQIFCGHEAECIL